MKLLNVKVNIIVFILSYILFVSLFSFISYKFIINDSLELEKNQNINNVKTILNSMNTNIENISNITADYSNWDDTYDFMIDENKDYLHDNFRAGTNTLNELDINFVLFANKKDKVLFSKYNNDDLKNSKKDFEKKILNEFKDIKYIDTIMKYKSLFLYIVKAKVLKSDATGSVQGWMYTGKLIKNKNLNVISKVFDTIKLSKFTPKNAKLSISLSKLKNIKVHTFLSTTKLTNSIAFYDASYRPIFSIITTNKRELINNSERTIFILNAITAFFLFVITLIIYKNHHTLISYNKLLELKVDRRTDQLSKSLRKLQTSNKKLYSLANTDTLTKICNRRSYFSKSERLLERSILRNKNFSVLMIDIDHFKKVNDTYGHAIGDKVLIEFSNIINSLIKDEVFGRIGGEEFCVTFYDKEEDDIFIVSEKIRLACENSVIKVEDNNIKFTVSLGLCSRANLNNIDEILHVCDELLYKAKNGGRNRLIRRSPK